MGIIDSFKKGFHHTDDEKEMIHARNLIETELMIRRELGVRHKVSARETVDLLNRDIPGRMCRTVRGCRQIIIDLFNKKR